MRKVEIGKRLDDKKIIKVKPVDLATTKNKVLYILNSTMFFRTPEESELFYKDVEKFCSFGLKVREFEKVLKEKINSMFLTNRKYDSLNQQQIEEETSIVKPKKIKDEETGLEIEQDMVETIVDLIGKTVLGIDPYLDGNLYSCSKE